MTANEFFDLEKTLIESGQDSDLYSFAEIKQKLMHRPKLGDREFAYNVIYVILASGFSQKTAKKIYNEIINFLMCNVQSSKCNLYNDLIKIFKNKNKINAICDVWENRKKYRDEYYKIGTRNGNKEQVLSDKLAYLAALPHVGKITANHLARNLGENVFKRDVWIDRLLKKHGPDLLKKLSHETNLPIGYVDVVLWKALQIGLLKL